jgi:hypothetical protein
VKSPRSEANSSPVMSSPIRLLVSAGFRQRHYHIRGF